MAFPLQHSRGRRSGLCCGGDCTAEAIWRPCERLWRYIRGALSGTEGCRVFRDWQGRRRSLFFVINRICFLCTLVEGVRIDRYCLRKHILDIAKACINSRQEYDKKTSAFALKTGQRSGSSDIWDKFIYKFFYSR